MSSPYFMIIASAVALAAMSFAAVSSAEAHRYRRGHVGVAVGVGVGGPVVYGGYRHYDRPYYYGPSRYYRGYAPVCLRWGWVHNRSGKAKWSCLAW